VDRAKKEEQVASLHQLFNETSVLVVTQYSGLNVAQLNELRDRMQEEGASFKVIKNRLTRLALADTKFQDLSDLFIGPTAIAYSEDPVSAPKAVVNFAKKNENLVVLGGFFGEQRLDIEGVKALASLPSLDELRGGIVGMLKTPATRIASVLQAPGGQLARVLGAYAQSGEAA
jgi:large subunit ribosomal protein L10